MVKMTSLRSPLVTLAWFPVVAACSSVTASRSSDPSACEAIVTACHGSVSAMGLECHKLGHAGNSEACSSKKDACVLACPANAKDRATSLDASSDADAGVRASCQDYCSCMGKHCTGMPNYPFDSDEICLNACSTWSTQDANCFLSWCTQAGTSDAGTQHACDHASSRLGAIECF
jgi:hypothetical protein